MKKKLIIAAAIVLSALLAGAFYFQNTYLILDGEVYRRDLETLDLSDTVLEDPEALTQLRQLQVLDLRGTGLTAEEYEMLHEMLPECRIRWLVPFQGDYLETDIRELTVSSITEEEMETLAYFTQLQTIDAESCEDLDAVMALKERYPGCEIRYHVAIGGKKISADTKTLEVMDADCAELMEALRYLPGLKSVSFAGEIPENDGIYQLKQAYPDMEFLWSFQLCGVTVDSDAAEIDFSGITMTSVEEVEESLKYFSHLEKVIMCDCGISSEDMDALWKRNPDTRFVWNIRVGDYKVRTDVTTFMPFLLGYGRSANDEKLSDGQCKELKYLVDVVCMDIGHMSVRDLSFAAYMPNLEYLLICGNGVSDISPLAGLQKLKYVELFANNITDISALAECPALEDVNLCYNAVTDITPLLELENLNNLWIAGRYLTEEQILQLQEAHPNAKIVTDAYRSTGRGWRDLPNYFAQRDLLGLWYMTTED